MTHKEKAEKYVRSQIKELMELSFGCEFREPHHNEKENFVIKGEYDGHIFAGLDKSKYGENFRYEKSFILENMEIIGHPIQLSHILQLVDRKHFTQVLDLYDLTKSFSEQDEELYQQLCRYWNV